MITLSHCFDQDILHRSVPAADDDDDSDQLIAVFIKKCKIVGGCISLGLELSSDAYDIATYWIGRIE
jgi:hypothetical protein